MTIIKDSTKKINMKKHALEYASKGYHVLPLHSPDEKGRCSCGKPDCSSCGKHPRVKGGVNSATSDIETIKKWWNHSPNANIGIATGKSSNIVVLDFFSVIKLSFVLYGSPFRVQRFRVRNTKKMNFQC